MVHIFVYSTHKKALKIIVEARVFLRLDALLVFCPGNSPRSIVKCRRVLQLVRLRFLMIDPKLRVIKRNQVGHALHR